MLEQTVTESVRDAEIDETIEREIALCEAVLKKTRQIIGDAQIMIDHTFHPRPLELAKLLLTHGFSVTRIYLDAVNPEEKATFEWLKQQYPGLSYEPTIHPEMRMRPRKEENVLAIGQKAACLRERSILSIWWKVPVCMDLMESGKWQD